MKFRLIAFTVVLMALVCVGCSHKDKQDTPTPTDPVVTLAPTGTTDVTDADVTQAPTDTTPTPSETSGVTIIPLDDDDDDDLITTDAPDTDTGDDDDDPDDEFDSADYALEDLSPEERRAIAWSETLLVWIPEADIGTFREVSSSPTYDYAVFDVTTPEEIGDARDYVAALPSAGFDVSPSTYDTATGFVYEASNSEGWCVSVVLDDGTLTIGSGYPDETFDNDSAVSAAWADPLLAELPLFCDGILVSSMTENNGGEFRYAVFDNVSDEYASSYLGELKGAGFTIDEDEGVMGGIIWYSAGREDLLVCDYLYSDHVVKIGCGRYSD